jgi:hypothetical protein
MVAPPNNPTPTPAANAPAPSRIFDVVAIATANVPIIAAAAVNLTRELLTDRAPRRSMLIRSENGSLRRLVPLSGARLKTAMAEKLSVPSANKNSSAGNGSSTKRFPTRDGNSTARSCQSYRATVSKGVYRNLCLPETLLSKPSIFKTAPKKACSALNARKLQPTAVTI